MKTTDQQERKELVRTRFAEYVRALARETGHEEDNPLGLLYPRGYRIAPEDAFSLAMAAVHAAGFMLGQRKGRRS